MVLKKNFCLWKHVKKIFQPDQNPPPPPLEVKWSLPYYSLSNPLSPAGARLAPGGYEIARADDFWHTRAS